VASPPGKIYNCQICDDLLPTALALEEKLKNDENLREDFLIVQGNDYLDIMFSNV
jgi:hypothetical protein